MSDNTLYVSMEFDAKQMIRILGNDLYDSPLAMLRENVQNAYDAILERKQVDSDFSPIIKVEISDTQIIIEDNGPGISEEAKQKLFTPFFTTKSSGQGIGLMFVREVLTNHRCRFSLSTEEGYTRFKIFFEVI